MKNIISIICFIFIASLTTYSMEKKVKVNGVVYIIEIENGTARVDNNYKYNKNTIEHIGILKGDVVLESDIVYRKKHYPVTSIGPIAFIGCKDVATITISNNIKRLCANPLSCLSNLKRINVNSGNKYFRTIDGVLFSNDMTEIVSYPAGRTDTFYTIPATVKIIGKDAFRSCNNLLSIEIPNSVKCIKAGAFSFSNIKYINVPISVVEIGDKAFYYCDDLVSFTYKNKDLTFSSNVFEKCDHLLPTNIVYEVPKELFWDLANKGDIEYQYKLAICYLEGEGFPKNVDSAKEWLKKAANNGHVLSQNILGDVYSNESGNEKNIDEAIKWYTLAAKNGNSTAQIKLGNFFFSGKGVKQNYSTAMEYFKQAAIQGDCKGEEALGHCAYFGFGGKPDYYEAIKWYTLSANKGNAESAYWLAICYNKGQGTEKNDIEALKWIEKAVEAGLEKSKDLFCNLAYDDAVKSMNLKSYSSAISRFNSLLKYDNTNVDAYINRGYCYLNLQVKDYSRAEKDFQKALEIDAKNEIAINNLKVVNEYNKKIKDAKDFCDKGDQYYNKRDYSNAVACYAKSISLDSSKPYTYYSLGYCYFDCDLYAEAISYFDQALSVDPNYENAKKAIKRARAIGILNAISQSLTVVSNSLNSAYNSSVNYGNTTSYQSSSSSLSSTTGSKRKCGYCSGTGKCPYCNSAGQSKACVQNQFGAKCSDSYCIAKNHRCSHCSGTHICSNCKGSGYK